MVGGSLRVRGFYDTTIFTFHAIVQLHRHLVADLFWYSGVPTYTFTIICQNLKDVCIVFSTGGNLFIDGMELHLASFWT